MHAADAIAEGLDSGDESPNGSPERKSPEGIIKAKKKKISAGNGIGMAKKKVKKTVFRNNFIKESDSNQGL